MSMLKIVLFRPELAPSLFSSIWWHCSPHTLCTSPDLSTVALRMWCRNDVSRFQHYLWHTTTGKNSFNIGIVEGHRWSLRRSWRRGELHEGQAPWHKTHLLVQLSWLVQVWQVTGPKLCSIWAQRPSRNHTAHSTLNMWDFEVIHTYNANQSVEVRALKNGCTPEALSSAKRCGRIWSAWQVWAENRRFFGLTSWIESGALNILNVREKEKRKRGGRKKFASIWEHLSDFWSWW